MSPRGKPNPHARALLLAATERLIRRDGIEAVTTRTVAREAQVATGLLYNYFADKDELLVALLDYRLRAAGTRLTALPARAGTRTVRENLVEIVAESLDTLLAYAPLLAVLMSRPDLRPGADQPTIGPDREEAIVPARAYLQAELRAGRIRHGSDVDAAAMLLVGACHDLALHRALRRDSSPIDPALPQRLVDTLLAGLDPAPPAGAAPA
jgi:AcrR family transcriptional regulator